MRKILLFAAVFTVMIASCKKDDSGPKPQNLLDKIVTKEGSDSAVTTITYNSQNKITGESTDDKINDYTSARVFARDNAGRITKITDNESSPGTATSSTFTDYFYLTAAETKLKNGLATFPQGSVTVRDSSAYTYTGNNVTRISHFLSTPTFPVAQVYYYEFKYDTKGNLTELKSFFDNAPGTGNFQLGETITYTYDDKINPLYSPESALVESITDFLYDRYVSPNNVVGLNYVGSDPADNFSANFTYEYRADGRPTKSTLTVVGFTSVSTYSYK
jgi:hypothetical protein